MDVYIRDDKQVVISLGVLHNDKDEICIGLNGIFSPGTFSNSAASFYMSLSPETAKSLIEKLQNVIEAEETKLEDYVFEYVLPEIGLPNKQQTIKAKDLNEAVAKFKSQFSPNDQPSYQIVNKSFAL